MNHSGRPFTHIRPFYLSEVLGHSLGDYIYALLFLSGLLLAQPLLPKQDTAGTTSCF